MEKVIEKDYWFLLMGLVFSVACLVIRYVPDCMLALHMTDLEVIKISLLSVAMCLISHKIYNKSINDVDWSVYYE